MTGYIISPGYNGHGTTRLNAAEIWGRLKFYAQLVAAHPADIVAEAKRLGAPDTCPKGCCTLMNYALAYTYPIGEHGNPVSFNEEERRVVCLASTDHDIKYHIRRAYCRLVIEAMHREQIDVTFVVG